MTPVADPTMWNVPSGEASVWSKVHVVRVAPLGGFFTALTVWVCVWPPAVNVAVKLSADGVNTLLLPRMWAGAHNALVLSLLPLALFRTTAPQLVWSTNAFLAPIGAA